MQTIQSLVVVVVVFTCVRALIVRVNKLFSTQLKKLFLSTQYYYY